MSDTPAHIKPEVLRWARERAGLTPLELAARLQDPYFSVLLAESGGSQPTIDQARAWAKACGVSLATLYLPEPPAEPGPLELPEALECVLDWALESLAAEEERRGGREGVERRHGTRITYESVEMVRAFAREMGERKDESVAPCCEDCGSPGTKEVCPYTNEIYGEEVEVVLCSDCYNQRVWDI